MCFLCFDVLCFLCNCTVKFVNFDMGEVQNLWGVLESLGLQ